MIASVYASMQNLKSRKTTTGLSIFNSLIESGLVHFLLKEEKKVVEVNIKELSEARKTVEKTLAAVKAIDFIKEEGPAVEEHTMPLTEDVVSEDGYKVSLMPKRDIRNLYIGELTACCQKLGGAGEDVCIEGWKDKHSANYVLTTASGTVLGHFWLYETVDGGFVIDSVEARQSLDVEKLTTLVKSWVSTVRPNRKLYISDCYFGITQKVIATLRKGFSLLAEEEPASAFNPEGHYAYRDSRHGVFSIN